MSPLVPFFRNLFRRGRLTVVDAIGRAHLFGAAAGVDLRPVTIRLHDRALHWRLPLHPGLVTGEAYMDGSLTVDDGGLYDFLALASVNLQDLQTGAMPMRWLQQWNPISVSRRRTAHHYDLSEEFFSLFLDDDSQYSCAFFSDPEVTLEAAQAAKKQRLITKLRLQPGLRVLDIGCGWGGLALSMAREFDVEVTGITLSEGQLRVARRRAAEAGLSHRLRFELADYRQLAGSFDRVISVGMFEHVVLPHYPTFFRSLRHLLAPRGIALVHAIGRSLGPGATNAWIRRYIFPGGYTPALSEVLPCVERAGLWVGDIEILRPHYADTLRHWRTRFTSAWDHARAITDERFCRMWEFYLAGAEAAFRHQDLMVWQMQMGGDGDALPRSRDYMSYPRC